MGLFSNPLKMHKKLAKGLGKVVSKDPIGGKLAKKDPVMRKALQLGGKSGGHMSKLAGSSPMGPMRQRASMGMDDAENNMRRPNGPFAQKKRGNTGVVPPGMSTGGNMPAAAKPPMRTGGNTPPVVAPTVRGSSIRPRPSGRRY